MKKNQVVDYLLSKPEAVINSPFGENTEVYYVKGKVFALLSFGKNTEKTDSKMLGHYYVNLKCDPNEALMLRDIFPSVIPAYHMNKIVYVNIPTLNM